VNHTLVVFLRICRDPSARNLFIFKMPKISATTSSNKYVAEYKGIFSTVDLILFCLKCNVKMKTFINWKTQKCS